LAERERKMQGPSTWMIHSGDRLGQAGTTQNLSSAAASTRTQPLPGRARPAADPAFVHVLG